MLVLENVKKYTPAVTWGTTAPSAATIATVGWQQKIGRMVHFYAKVTFTDVGSGGSGTLSISLPSVQSGTITANMVQMMGTTNVIACPTNTNYLLAKIASKKINIVACASDADPVQAIAWADLVNGDIIEVAGWYYEQ